MIVFNQCLDIHGSKNHLLPVDCSLTTQATTAQYFVLFFLTFLSPYFHVFPKLSKQSLGKPQNKSRSERIKSRQTSRDEFATTGEGCRKRRGTWRKSRCGG